jgi:toxin CcdB
MSIPCREKEGAVRSVAAGLNPVFSIKGKRHVRLTQALAAVASRELREAAGSLQEQRETVLLALDLPLTGL